MGKENMPNGNSGAVVLRCFEQYRSNIHGQTHTPAFRIKTYFSRVKRGGEQRTREEGGVWSVWGASLC